MKIKYFIFPAGAVLFVGLIASLFTSTRPEKSISSEDKSEKLVNVKPVFNEYDVNYEIETAGKLGQQAIITEIKGNLTFYKKAFPTVNYGETLSTHMVLKLSDLEVVVSAKDKNQIDASSLKGRVLMISPPTSNNNGVDISYTGGELEPNLLELIRMIVQNFNPIVFHANAQMDYSFSREDLYGKMNWKWKYDDSSSPKEIKYSFADRTKDSPRSIESWMRNLSWSYLETSESFTLKGSEKIELSMNSNHIMDLDIYAFFTGVRGNLLIEESELLQKVSSLNTFKLAGEKVARETNVSSELSYDDLKRMFFSEDLGPTFYSEVAAVLRNNKVSQQEIISTLQRLKPNTSSYKALVLGLAFANAEYKKVLISYIRNVDDEQKMNLIPLLSQGPEIDNDIISFLEGVSKTASKRNLVSAAALTMGTAYHSLGSGKMKGAVDKDNLFNILKNGLSDAVNEEDVSLWISALGNTGNPLLPSILTPFLKAPSEYVREKAYFSLRNIKNDSEVLSTLRLIFEGLKDQSSDVRKRAAMAGLSILENSNMKLSGRNEIEDNFIRMRSTESSDKVLRVLDKVIKHIEENMR